MGKFDFEIDPAFLRSLGKLSDVDKYAPQMIDAATPILEKNIKSALAGHRRTGTMVNSVKRTRAKKAKNGTYLATVRPTGMSKNTSTSTARLKSERHLSAIWKFWRTWNTVQRTKHRHRC